MNRYKILLNGRNFLINTKNELKTLGFYTTRIVEAVSEDESAIFALDILKNDKELIDMTKNKESNPPMLYVDEISLINDLTDAEDFGFSFYDESNEE
ncbi:MAG: hypothetical protein ACJA1Z_003381 [Patiriisocius sp.]|jgi:hypothetical protein